MKYKDYKFWFIRRDDDGFIIEAGIRFFEGHFEKEIYKRTKKLDRNDLRELNAKFIKDASNNDAVFYAQKNFGKIKTDDELRLFLNKQLDKVKGREAIAEQKWQN